MGIPYFKQVAAIFSLATRYNFLTVGAVRNGGKFGVSGGLDSEIGFVAEVTETDGLVFGGGYECFAVVAKRDGSNLVGMPRECLCTRAAEGVPDMYTIVLQVVVFRGGYDVFPVTTEKGRTGSQGVEALAFLLSVLKCILDVKQPNGVVSGGCEDIVVIGGEESGSNAGFVAINRKQTFSVVGIPYFYGCVVGS